MWIDGRRPIATALLVGMLWTPGTQALAQAQTVAEPAPPSEVERIARRTATYQVVSSFNDFVYGALFAGGIAAGGVLAVASLVTEPILHFLHETAWGRVSPPADRAEALQRVPIKSATYTLANSGRVFASAWLISGNPVVAAGMVAFNAVADATVYAVNDAAWAHFTAADAPVPGGAGAP